MTTITENEILAKALQLLVVRGLVQFTQCKYPNLCNLINRRIAQAKEIKTTIDRTNSIIDQPIENYRVCLIALNEMKLETNSTKNELEELQAKLIEAIHILKAKKEPQNGVVTNPYKEALFSINNTLANGNSTRQ